MDEIKRILEMVKEGKLSPDEGSRLINALNEKDEQSNNHQKKSRWLKIVVKSKENSPKKENVNIRIPLNIMKTALKLGGKFNFAIPEEAKLKMEEKGIDINELMGPEGLTNLIGELGSSEPYTLVDVDDEDETVKIFIE
ncbi:hypothetical protein DRP44_05020 [candidate division TA06 bacterium]|uniref:YvlB/LiaX N-terminal domain-containing protein n=1 Tax=candidate division TA06 bacterium TaxID=2250710 RepID=A0A660S7R7_UNCT6|nr:MAG: hypothetical protein DRP44_05020 [candidate division TA06 bacterium]